MFAWVDPGRGEDTSAQVNDSDAPFRTLQLAIDTLHQYLIDNYPSSPPPGSPVTEPIKLEGLVYALPGLYGPHGPESSGDALPIRMKDRVHVQGLGARRVVLRGVGVPNTVNGIFWPTQQPALGSLLMDKEILLDLSNIHGCDSQPPWCQGGADEDTLEFLDGFTFQGGDVQVYAAQNFSGSVQSRELAAVISNCLFDMRHNWFDQATGNTIAGPSIGVMMSKPFQTSSATQGAVGYVDQKLLIANNTFIFARRGVTQAGGTPEWMPDSSKMEAVGILDACDPGCGDPNNAIDCENRVRGLGSPGIINNVFRTRDFDDVVPPPTVRPYAMVGIDLADTLMVPSGAGPQVQSNVFASELVGDGNGEFFSDAVVPVMVTPASPGTNEDAFWHCIANPMGFQLSEGDCNNKPTACQTLAACTPANHPDAWIELYNGENPPPTMPVGIDPGFIGEFLSMMVPGLESYVDWRLLPGDGATGSPLKDNGYVPYGEPITMANGSTFEMHARSEISPWDWDGEHYGNPRIVDGFPDVGFDEVHLYSMAGSYGNHSNNHNNTPMGALNPSAAAGKPDRYAFVRESAGGIDLLQGFQIKIHGVQEAPSSSAWAIPPGVLSIPLDDNGMPLDYRTKYISFNNQSSPVPPTPFTENLTPTSFVNGWKAIDETPNISNFVWMTPANSLGGKLTDDEGSEHAYFSTQALIHSAPAGTKLLRGNLQVEYR